MSKYPKYAKKKNTRIIKLNIFIIIVLKSRFVPHLIGTVCCVGKNHGNAHNYEPRILHF